MLRFFNLFLRRSVLIMINSIYLPDIFCLYAWNGEPWWGKMCIWMSIYLPSLWSLFSCLHKLRICSLCVVSLTNPRSCDRLLLNLRKSLEVFVPLQSTACPFVLKFCRFFLLPWIFECSSAKRYDKATWKPNVLLCILIIFSNIYIGVVEIKQCSHSVSDFARWNRSCLVQFNSSLSS